ncbi:hypothetical protein H5410_059940 [Solanum commersonii]|uniref:Uncharacterized protein n=1 Tax=Solanum commersonii TaxID=4109 RepID=A0A9J5W507_SOLCO|nr:hypothetical protein H5410_059940 [Solanum commersonii]
MGFLDFFPDKDLGTILKAVPFNRDLQERILWRIIDGMRKGQLYSRKGKIIQLAASKTSSSSNDKKFDKISNKQLIKTTEQSLALNSSEQTIHLLNKRDIELYKSQYKFLHIGMVQIAFKPLTFKGLPETFLAALRDARNLNFRQSLMGSIESTVAYGLIYFNAQPNLQLYLIDSNILDVLTLNVKTHGYNYAPGSELICLSYRIYYKLLATLNPRCKLYDTSDQTILVETNFARSMVTTRRPIKWEEINFPITWILDSVIPPDQMTDAVTNSEYYHISQNFDGKFICSLMKKVFLTIDILLLMIEDWLFNIFLQ